MTIRDLTNPRVVLPRQLVLDSSVLLALRKGDDNPHAAAAYRFVERLGREVADRRTIAWLLMPVLQECYHVILSWSLRRTWAVMPTAARPLNWLALYKQQPEVLSEGFADLATFDEILASIPVTPVYPGLIESTRHVDALRDRMRHFITAYHLLPQDAFILAESERIGVTAVATLDADWRRVAEFDIYTTPR